MHSILKKNLCRVLRGQPIAGSKVTRANLVAKAWGLITKAWQVAEKVSTGGEREIWSAPTAAALWIRHIRHLQIQSGVALRLPPHSKYVLRQPAKSRLRLRMDRKSMA